MRYPVLILILTVLFTPMRLSAQEGGNALRFDNSDFTTGGDFVYFPNHDYAIGDVLTVAAWVYWDSSPNGPVSNPHEPSENKRANLITLDYHDSIDQGQFWLQHNSGNTKFEWAVQSVSVRTAIQSSTVPQPGKWYFLVGVYDGSPAQGTTTMRLYVNGIEESSANTSVISGDVKLHNGHMRLNFARISSDYRLFNGTIDAVRFWKRALTREEIRKQMHSSTTVNPAALVGYYNLNSSSGTSVLDSTGTLDGTFYTALVDVHSTGTNLCATIPFTHFTSSSPWQIADGDKNWSASNYANMPTRTVSGAGIDQTNTIVSNTCNTLTLQYGWAGSGADTIVTPILDGDPNDTWFGIENTSQTSQWIVSTAPVFDNWAFAATITPMIVGASGSRLQASITSTPDSSNNAIVYMTGSASDPAVTGESFPSGVTARGAVIWGNAVFGSVTQTLDFEYGSFPGIVDPTQVKLLQRATPTDSWTEVPSTGLTNNTTTMTFTLTGVSTGWQYAIGVDQGINPLPVDLVLFQAHRKNDMVELHWKTHNEVNSFAFDIESRHGSETSTPRPWIRLASVPAAGNSASPKQYNWLHAHPFTGTLEYRLRMVDRDGTFRYSEIVRLHSNYGATDMSFSIYPNPSRGQLTVQSHIEFDAPVRIVLVDVLGRERTVLTNGILEAGGHVWTVNLKDLRPGQYYLRVTNNEEQTLLPITIVQ